MTDYSTPRVQKHRALKIQFDFCKKSTLSRIERAVKKTVSSTVSQLASAEKKAILLQSVINSQSSLSKSTIQILVSDNSIRSAVKNH